MDTVKVILPPYHIKEIADWIELRGKGPDGKDALVAISFFDEEEENDEAIRRQMQFLCDTMNGKISRDINAIMAQIGILRKQIEHYRQYAESVRSQWIDAENEVKKLKRILSKVPQ